MLNLPRCSTYGFFAPPKLGDFWGKNADKYSSTMEHTGLGSMWRATTTETVPCLVVMFHAIGEPNEDCLCTFHFNAQKHLLKMRASSISTFEPIAWNSEKWLGASKPWQWKHPPFPSLILAQITMGISQRPHSEPCWSSLGRVSFPSPQKTLRSARCVRHVHWIPLVHAPLSPKEMG